jgi:hypothetical protein
MSEPLIAPVARVEARAAPFAWPWATESREAIEANWAQKTAQKPKMFNGKVLLLRSLTLADGCCRATYFETDF